MNTGRKRMAPAWAIDGWKLAENVQIEGHLSLLSLILSSSSFRPFPAAAFTMT
jgi:hypothetical protein